MMTFFPSLLVICMTCVTVTSSYSADKCNCGCECGPKVDYHDCCDEKLPSLPPLLPDPNMEMPCGPRLVAPPPLPEDCPRGVEHVECHKDTCHVTCEANRCATCLVYSCGACYPIHFFEQERILCERPKCPDFIDVQFVTDLSLAQSNLNRSAVAAGILAGISGITIDPIIGYDFGSILFANVTQKLFGLDYATSFGTIQQTVFFLLNTDIPGEIGDVSGIDGLDIAMHDFEVNGRSFLERQAILYTQANPSIDPAGLRTKLAEARDKGYHVIVLGFERFAANELPAIAAMGVYTISMLDNDDLVALGPRLRESACVGY